jgi:hypothetical protein
MESQQALKEIDEERLACDRRSQLEGSLRMRATR